ncbi:Phosphate-binding protein PstS [Sporomusa rhizae]|uniref:phosphate ABC transporter substrate-binding protein n=1 Tax=Sporomusa rhizae TaxID=357999 RepID=UPI00352A9EFB
MKKLITYFLVVALLAFVAGCGSSPTNNQPAKDLSIKIGGSSTLAPVVAKLADDYTEKYKTWKKVKDSFSDEPIAIFVATGGSGFGVKSATNGTVDIGLVSRVVTEAEKQKLPNHKLYTVGYDALTIAVHPQNPVAKVKPNLTKDEVKHIFSGEIKTWKQLDAALPDRPIVLAIRDLGGGASQAFDEAVMKGTPVAKEAIQFPSMGALAGKVQENVDAVGYVSTGLVQQNKGKIAVLSVDGVEPTNENIVSGKYTIARPLILIAKAQPDERQQEFINYLLSDTGLKTLEDMGFVPAKNK